MMSDSGFDGYRGELNRNCVTIPEVMKTAGYGTYMAGKWHVTQKIQPKDNTEKHNWPLQRGFDRFYGTIHGAGSFYDPNSLTRDNDLISPAADSEYQPENGFYYTDAIGDHAVQFITDHENARDEKPFFVYVSFTAAHWPMHAREKEIAKYQGKYDVGYQATRDARYARMLDLGVIQTDNTQNWLIDPDWLETEHLQWDIRNMEVYAAMIDRMDQNIGKIVRCLEQHDELDNTLILFFQDNGGCAENYGRNGVGPERASSPPLPPLKNDYLQPDMQPKQTRDGYPVRTGKGVMAGPSDTYIGYGRGWATVSNTPFREYKHWVHEGGISTPLIAHWPEKITRHGSLDATPSHLIDLMATAVDLAQADYPTHFHEGNEIQPMEGTSLVPTFSGKPIPRDAIYWEHEGNRAIRVGDMKLVAKGEKGAWELYDISQDRSEQLDLAREQPELVAELEAKWHSWAERAKVLPLVPYRKNKNEKFKKNKLRFQLEQGDDLDRFQAPYVKGRGFKLTAKLSTVKDGVIAAQGGVTHGWALYIQESKLCFATTTNGTRTVIRSKEILVDGGIAAVTLTKDGEVSLAWNNQTVASGSLNSLLADQPLDGLQIGQDRNGNVGNYKSPFVYPGTITNPAIKLTK